LRKGVRKSSMPRTRGHMKVTRKTVARRISRLRKRKQTRRAFRESEGRFQSLVKKAVVPIAMSDLTGRITYANSALADLVGYSVRELVGRPFVDLLHPEDRERITTLFQEGVSRSIGGNIELRAMRKDGQVLHLVSRPTRLRIKGETVGFQAIILDVTDYKRIQDELTQERDKATAYLDVAGVIMVAIDKDERVTLLNRKACEFLGYAREEALGKNWFDTFLPARLREEVRSVFRKLMAGKLELVEYYENPVLTRDGTELLIAWQNTILRDAEGRIVCTLSSGTDITERRQMEEALRASELKYRTLFEEIPSGIYRTTPDGKMLVANPELVRMLGYGSEAELLAVDVARDLYVKDKDRDILLKRLELAGELRNVEINLRRKDGQHLVVLANTHVVRDQKGRVLYYEGALRDITDRKKMEEAIRRQTEVLQKTYDSMSDAIFLLDATTPPSAPKILECNTAACSVFGYEKAEMLGKSTDFLHVSKDALGEFQRQLYPAVAQGRLPFHLAEFHMRRKDGSVFPSEHFVAELSEKGERVGWVSVVRDITERKRMEEKLDALHKHSMQLGKADNLDEVVNSTLDAMEFTLGFQYAGFVVVENGLARLRGYRGMPGSVKELPLDGPGVVVKVVRTGKTVMIADTRTEPTYVDVGIKTSTGEPLQMLSELAVPVIVEGSVVSVLNVEGTKLGAFTKADQMLTETLAMHVSSGMVRLRQVQNLRDRAEQLTALQETVLDVTGRPDLPELLRTIVERAARLLHAHGGGMYLSDPERKELRCVVSYNTGRDYTGLVLKYGEGAAGTVAMTGQSLIIDDYRVWQGRAAAYEEDKPFTAVLSVPMTWQNRLVGVIHVLEDEKIRHFTPGDMELLKLFANHAAIAVGNARLLDQAQRHSSDLERIVEERTSKLKQAERLAAIGETTAMVGHDLRNPLQAITSTIYLTQKKFEALPATYAKLAEESGVVEMFKTIDEQIRYMDKIVSDLQDYASPLEPRPVEITMQRLMDDARMTVTIPETVKLSIFIEEGLPMVTVDSALMKRVFTNLIANAIQAMPAGGDLRIAASRTGEDALVSFRDTGLGIPQENLNKMFSPFFTTKPKGQGLGLPVCKRIVEAHGGSITVESRPGEGSTFTVRLPLRK